MYKRQGLTCGVDFKVGYSPERINPGDKVHRLETIVKIVSGMDEETLDTIAKVYELVVEAGVYRACLLYTSTLRFPLPAIPSVMKKERRYSSIRKRIPGIWIRRR